MARQQRNLADILMVFTFLKIHWKVLNISNTIRFPTSRADLREVLVTVPLSKIILGIGGTSPRFSSQLKTILKDDWESGQQASTKTM